MYVVICSGAVTQVGDGAADIQVCFVYLFDLMRNSRTITSGTTCLICDRHVFWIRRWMDE